MTLNITVSAPWGIYQSTDFQLYRIGRGGSATRMPGNSVKQVHITYWGGANTGTKNGEYIPWQGLITYCGIGEGLYKETHEWLVEWLKHDDGQQRMLGEVVETIQVKGSLWLKEIVRQNRTKHLDTRHTFVLGAFIGSEPHVVLISNYEGFNRRPQDKPTDELFVTSIQPIEPDVRITGRSETVSGEQRTLLKTCMRVQLQPLMMYDKIREVNRRAAENQKSKGAISRACLVQSILPDNTSAGMPFGDTNNLLNLQILVNGIDVGKQLKDALHQLSGGNLKKARLVQTTGVIVPAKDEALVGSSQDQTITVNWLKPTGSSGT